MPILKLPAPAKLNLFLHIIGRRADGYHLLQTVFQFLDICDELEFQITADKEIKLQPALASVSVQQNLIWRAATLLQQQTQCQLGATITLKKKIPMGGGLGGGSSDAATTLMALNQLWQTKLSLNELAKLGLQLGADVPVFIHGHAAWAEGVGEKLIPIELPASWFLVIVPPCHVATAEIFTAPELTRNTAPITIGQFLAQGGHNDCEAVVRKYYPEVDQALNWLAQFAPAKMTGTGGCVFASFADQQQALAVAKQIPKPFQGLVAKGLTISPLHSCLQKCSQGR